MAKKIKAEQPKTAPRRIMVEDVLAHAMKRPVTSADVKKAYALPASLGCRASDRIALDRQLTRTVGFDSMCGTLADHANAMGQFPMTGFIGYGALQQIAQNGMVRNCIKTVADDVTREWITITGGKDTPTERIEELEEEQKKFKLQELFNSAIAKVGFMGGAFIFIDTGVQTSEGDDVDLSLPLHLNSESAEVGLNSELRFVVVDPVNVSPGEYNSIDPLRADYMKPRKWFVLGKTVHATRLLPLYANEPPVLFKPAYNFLGIPQAQILWDYILHWNECRVNAQELIHKMNLLVYYTNSQERMATMGGLQELDAIMEVLQHYRDNNSVFLADSDTDKVENIATTITGVSDIVKQAQEMIAAVNRTPAVKLFGISPSGFNATGESDIRNYNDHIRSQQELYRAAIQTCLDALQLKLWGTVDPSITFEWNEVDMDNESAQAANFNARVTALAALKDRNAISADEMRQAMRSEKCSHLAFLAEDAPEGEEGELLTDDGSGDLLAALMGGKHGENGEGN